MSMRQAIGAAAFVLVVAVAEDAFGQGTPDIRVLVYDVTGESGHVPTRALAESARVLNKAGISTRWIPCPASSEEMHRFPDCRVEGTEIMLRIIPSSPPGIRPSTLGTTMGKVYLTVFGDHVRATAMTARCSENIVLGYAITHEIGHLLLGPGHTKEGPMKGGRPYPISGWPKRVCSGLRLTSARGCGRKRLAARATRRACLSTRAGRQ